MARLFFSALVLLTLALAEGAPHKPKKVKCKDKRFPLCHNKDRYCPSTCLRDCYVNCSTCQPVCGPTPPPPPPPPPKPRVVKCKDKNYKKTCNKDLYCTASCPKTCVADCATCQPICPPLPPTPSYSPPPVVTPSPPLPPPTTSTPSPPPPATTPSPPPDNSEAAGGKRARCKNKSYPSCYYREHQCPAACPDQCEVDCVTCSPGAVCQDPRFIGADGITFYFHGKKDRNFCIVTDNNLHINAHFTGRRNENMGRDFTWVQSLGILFDNHQIFVGARKTATWDNAVDRLELSYDGLPVYLAEGEGADWQPNSVPSVTIKRSRDVNSVVVDVEGNFQIKATVVPITVLGGDREFASSSLFSTDCAVARFNGTLLSSANNFHYANLKCASGLDGRGVVCRR